VRTQYQDIEKKFICLGGGNFEIGHLAASSNRSRREFITTQNQANSKRKETTLGVEKIRLDLRGGPDGSEKCTKDQGQIAMKKA